MSTRAAADGFTGSPEGRASLGAIESRLASATGLLLVGLLVLGVFVAAAPSPDEDAYIGFVYAKSLHAPSINATKGDPLPTLVSTSPLLFRVAPELMKNAAIQIT